MRRSLEDLRVTALRDSHDWFPELNESEETRLVHAALGLAGETGEAVDVIKKWHRKVAPISELDTEALGSEIADVLIYLLHICSVAGIDPEAEYKKKRVINAARFGKDKT
jgi:NTP pyrophosphatase (non-canonical NTP hydrolase)